MLAIFFFKPKSTYAILKSLHGKVKFFFDVKFSDEERVCTAKAVDKNEGVID
jgi:hypothetical protein